MKHVDVAVIGAGFAGIGMGIRLRRRGIRSFLIFERADSLGGTWRDNTYPGVACDVPSHLYSYSFRPNAGWSAFYSPGDEIREYLVASANDEGLGEHLRLGTDVLGLTWDESAAHWLLETSRGKHTAGAVILACGRLTEPRIPDVPGIGNFAGDLFHSSRWDHGLDLRDKSVVVVGSGASAVQIVPRVAAQASRLIVLQRSAPYVIPRAGRPYSAAERGLLARDAEELARLRSQLFWKAEEAFAQRAGNPDSLAMARSLALGHLADQVRDPHTRHRLTPSYEIGCKRVLISSDYYPTFNQDNVMLEPSALAAVEGNTLVAANGARHSADVVVLATGFHAAEQPYARIIRGIDGRLLSEHWAGGMTAHASTVMNGFPNLFVINGPNAGLGHNSAIYMIETQIEYILAALRHWANLDGGVLNVRAQAEGDYIRMIDDMASSTVWMTGGCETWYRDARNGRLSLLWPGFAHEFRALNAEFLPEDFELLPCARPRIRAR
ncbi:NAD(P)/FAD-dependent oxidoreductase [Cryobacterium sp.]|jgi:cation diffusion facilitator CzcD-associated flavoprotein CzcO|uniref:flavin-containing monooxygenase n=1 Tax=Cryobacterium sp. TaxID=1926290 RepID=UPI0026264E2F|nr:NAD(P)/FAD-dependent oxidoreductase [Cryobacterium sp.]MCU1445587.1 putative flavoprotein involved in transport [Cryobacterium sp.]